MRRSILPGVQLHQTDKRNLILFCLFGFLFALIGSFVSGAWLQACYAVTIVGFLVFVTVWPLRTMVGGLTEQNGWRTSVLYGAGLHLALIIGFFIAGTQQELWVSDSRTLHLPGAELALSVLKGDAALKFDSAFGQQFQLSYFWAGLWIGLFGSAPIVTAIAMIVLKIATWTLFGLAIFRSFGARVASMAVLLLVTSPTQIFYNIVFYKEPMVQLLTVIAIFGTLEFLRAKKIRFFMLSILAIGALAVERIYLAPMLFAGLGTVFLNQVFGGRQKIWVSVLAFSGIGIFLFVFGTIYFRDFSIKHIFANLDWARQGYMNAPGVDKAWNADISYPIAFIKMLFTPFLHPNKFDVFKGFSAMLTWGAIPSQILTLFGLVGMWIGFKADRLRTFVLVLPLAMFLLLFTYLAPYSGRQRDSFYPIIALFAAIAIERRSSFRRHKAS